MAVPSCPALLTITVSPGPSIDAPCTPARNAAFWVPGVPIRMCLASPVAPGLAMSTLFDPVVRFWPALLPTAMLLDPVVVLSSALAPRPGVAVRPAVPGA